MMMGLPQEILSAKDVASSCKESPYPAQTRNAAGEVGGVLTEVMTVCFSDRIMVSISQEGRLAQWIHCPLSAANPSAADTYLAPSSGEDPLLPSNRFTPRSLLGAANSDREMVGQLYASQIANVITTKNPNENRTLILGLGLGRGAVMELDRDEFYKVIELVAQCL